MNKALSLNEAAARWNVKAATLRSRLLRGQIPASRNPLGEWQILERHIVQMLNWGKPFSEVMRSVKRSGASPLTLYS